MKLPVVFLEAVGQRQCRRSASTESIHDELGPQEEGGRWKDYAEVLINDV